MKPFILALLIALLPCAAHAANVQRIDVTEYGIYDTDTASHVVEANGVRHNDEVNVRHVATATKIPARAHLAFGMRYKIIGAPTGETAKIRTVIIFPKGGLHPTARAPLTMIDRVDDEVIGAETFTDYKFDEAWELAPGPWTFQFWVNGRKLAEKTFIVVTDDGPPVS